MGRNKKKVFIYGSGGHAKVVADAIEQQGEYTVAFLIDDNPLAAGNRIYGYNVVSGQAYSRRYPIKSGIVAIGDNKARSRIFDRLVRNGCELIKVVHPSAQVARGVVIGAGTVLMAGVIVNSDASIGKNVILNTMASVDHDCMIGKGVHIAPCVTLCGGVRIGDFSFVGAGATIVPNISVEREAIVGAGATVLSDVKRADTVAGTPAVSLKKGR